MSLRKFFAIDLVGVFRAYFPLIVVAAIIELTLTVLTERRVSPLDLNLLAELPGLLSIMVLSSICALAILVIISSLRQHPDKTRFQRISDWVKSFPWFEVVFLRLIPGMVFVKFTVASFGSYKPQLTDYAPFSWDPFLAELDRTLMFGFEGWEVTHGLLPGATMTAIIDVLYLVWFTAIISFYLYVLVQPLRDPGRLATMLAVALAWSIFGCFFATVFSSAGPVFYERVYGDPLYAPLLELLKAQSEIAGPAGGFTAIQASDYLWNGFTGTEGYIPAGITAFPSMHVCIAALIWLYARYRNRIAGWITLAYLVAIQIGSVHLGWHYMVDGLFSIIGAWLLWRACLRFANYWMRNLAPVPEVEGVEATQIPVGVRT